MIAKNSPVRNVEPAWRTIEQAQAELGGCSRSYVYALLKKGLLESTNSGGKRRLISSEAIRQLAEPGAP